ncbi:MAG TPA: SRPBCC domain-containing protein [Streptosporangiaceae bacterium]|nr:SRPBCC domain-containing protein [Streptosporangiaceae bacterium]
MRTATANSYTKTLTAETTAEEVFHALTDPGAITAWWSAASVTGSGQTGGELHITFGTEPEPTVMRVLAAHRPDMVIWDVAASPLVPDWVGTRPTFTMTPAGDGCRLDFAHHGLIPDLECFDRCATDWGHFLVRIADHVQGR